MAIAVLMTPPLHVYPISPLGFQIRVVLMMPPHQTYLLNHPNSDDSSAASISAAIAITTPLHLESTWTVPVLNTNCEMAITPLMTLLHQTYLLNPGILQDSSTARISVTTPTLQPYLLNYRNSGNSSAARISAAIALMTPHHQLASSTLNKS